MRPPEDGILREEPEQGMLEWSTEEALNRIQRKNPTDDTKGIEAVKSARKEGSGISTLGIPDCKKKRVSLKSSSILLQFAA